MGGGIFLSISEQLEKEKKIKQEVNRLKKIYKDLDKDKSKTFDGLINNAAFIKITLEELRENLSRHGYTEIFVQGEQCFQRERPEVKIYTTMVQRYTQVMKQLIDVMPPGKKEEENKGLESFMNKRKSKP